MDACRIVPPSPLLPSYRTFPSCPGRDHHPEWIRGTTQPRRRNARHFSPSHRLSSIRQSLCHTAGDAPVIPGDSGELRVLLDLLRPCADTPGGEGNSAPHPPTTTTVAAAPEPPTVPRPITSVVEALAPFNRNRLEAAPAPPASSAAARAAAAPEPPDSLCCPITESLFEDPVVLSDGHTYTRAAAEEWLRRGKTTSF